MRTKRIGAQLIGIYVFWRIQKYFEISTKKVCPGRVIFGHSRLAIDPSPCQMFVAVVVFTIVLSGWGMVGNWTDNFGFKSVWEIYLYQARPSRC
jgi:hypothetical protein